MHNGSLLAAFLLTVSTTGHSQKAHWPVAQGGNNHYYEVVAAPGGITWSQASLIATNRGGYLATITSSSESDFVFQLANQHTNIWHFGYGPWLGGLQASESSEPAGGWGWVTGEPFSFQNWAPSQPNNSGGNEDRIQLGGAGSNSSVWNDLAQDATNYARGFVVEYPRDPETIVLDFERINGAIPYEGMSVSNQFAPQFGISFRRSDGGFPVIARKGPPQATFNVSNVTPTLHDQLHPNDPRADEFGDFFLADDALPTTTHTIIMDFSEPVSRVSGYVFDVDGGDQLTFTAYSDYGTNIVAQLVLTKDSPETGEGRSAPWTLVRPTSDIRQVRVNAGTFGFDNITTSYNPPAPQAASLNLQQFAGVIIEGEVGRPYRIEYADALSPTNWITQTNLLLPTSPFTYIDMDSPGANQRFYRAVAVGD